MKKTLLIIIILFAFIVGGFFLVERKIADYFINTGEIKEKLDEIHEMLDREEFDSAFELAKEIVHNKYISVERMNAVVVKFQNKDRIEEGLYLLNVLLSKSNNNLSWAYHMLHKNESANYYADKALAIMPNSAVELCNKANALRGLGKSEEAIKYYDMALEKQSNISEAIWGKAMTYYDMKNYEKSVEFFKKYREIKPEDEESTRYYITSSYREMNRIADAVTEYINQSKKDRSNTSPYYSLAYLLFEQKDYKNALVYYDTIISTDPEDAWAYFYKADCYAKLDMLDEAIDALIKAVELNTECLNELTYLEELDKIKKHSRFADIFQ
ncbi:MAG: tetratricopeptide repeat protein [Bacillota bacterium]